MHCQYQHQHDQRQHHILGDPLKSALQMKAQDHIGDHHCHKQIYYIYCRICNHCFKAKFPVLSCQKLYKIVNDPSRHYRIKGDQCDISYQTEYPAGLPFFLLSRTRQLFIHI